MPEGSLSRTSNPLERAMPSGVGLTGIRVLLGILAAALCSGCSTLRVNTGSEADGIPFYKKVGVKRQHTVYAHTSLQVTLSFRPVRIAKDGQEVLGTAQSVTRWVESSQSSRQRISELNQASLAVRGVPFSDLQRRQADLLRLLNAIPEASAGDGSHPDTTELVTISNHVDLISVVDYSTVYYLNSRKPLFGSASIAAEVAADGTLAKTDASASAEAGEAIESIATGLATLAPIEEFLSTRWLPSSTSDKAMFLREMQVPLYPGDVRDTTDQTVGLVVEVSVQEKTVHYDFVRDLPPGHSIVDKLPHVPADFATGIFTRTVVDVKAKAPEAKDAVSFSGSITLPAQKKP